MSDGTAHCAGLSAASQTAVAEHVYLQHAPDLATSLVVWRSHPLGTGSDPLTSPQKPASALVRYLNSFFAWDQSCSCAAYMLW